MCVCVFFFNVTATTEIYTLSLHDALPIYPEAVRIQLDRLREVRSQRDETEVKKVLKKIRNAARCEENLIPHFIEAVKAYATLGEIIGVLKEEFGEFEEPRFTY